MNGWVGLVGWPTADVWPTKWSSVQLAVRRRTGKVRRSKTSVLPLCYVANLVAATPPWQFCLTLPLVWCFTFVAMTIITDALVLHWLCLPELVEFRLAVGLGDLSAARLGSTIPGSRHTWISWFVSPTSSTPHQLHVPAYCHATVVVARLRLLHRFSGTPCHLTFRHRLPSVVFVKE